MSYIIKHLCVNDPVKPDIWNNTSRASKM